MVGLRGLGLRVQGFVFRVQVLGFRPQGMGFRASLLARPTADEGNLAPLSFANVLALPSIQGII